MKTSEVGRPAFRYKAATVQSLLPAGLGICRFIEHPSIFMGEVIYSASMVFFGGLQRFFSPALKQNLCRDQQGNEGKFI